MIPGCLHVYSYLSEYNNREWQSLEMEDCGISVTYPLKQQLTHLRQLSASKTAICALEARQAFQAFYQKFRVLVTTPIGPVACCKALTRSIYFWVPIPIYSHMSGRPIRAEPDLSERPIWAELRLKRTNYLRISSNETCVAVAPNTNASYRCRSLRLRVILIPVAWFLIYSLYAVS